jgi:hypothetical protein
MDVSRFVIESATFTRATLAGKPSRWLVFILLGLPWTALSSRAESWKVLEGTTIRWDLIPWQEAGLLIGAGILCNLLLWGWIVRLLRNNSEPPEFDRPLLLCLDGIKAHTIPLVWMLVPAILAFLQFTIAGSRTASIVLWPPDPAESLILVLFAVQLLILFYAVQYGLIGMIRFARTGSVREAFALLEIRETAGRIGFVNYYLGFGVVVLAWMLFTLSLRGVSFLPYAGPFIALGLGPVPTVFCSRFVAHFCDEDQYPVTGGGRRSPELCAPFPLTSRALVAEYAVWLVILAVLVFLCFTPMALIAASVARFFP